MRAVLAGGAMALGAALIGCASLPPESPSGDGTGTAGIESEEELPPPGYGTLRQDDFTLDLRSGDLLVKVTPLEEWILRLAAPDTYERLSSLVHEVRGEEEGAGEDETGSLFLISFFSYAPEVVYRPERVELVNRGIRHRPRVIRPLTPGWGSQRLGQQETRTAVYLFDARIDLRQSLTAEYEGARNARWEQILPRLQAEESRVWSRVSPS